MSRPSVSWVVVVVEGSIDTKVTRHVTVWPDTIWVDVHDGTESEIKLLSVVGLFRYELPLR